MTRNLAFLSLLCIFFAFSLPKDFIGDQKKFEHVRTAFTDKEKTIEKLLSENKISKNEINLLIIAYKQEKQLEIFAKKKNESNYKKLTSYSICASSGELGPKRKYGDGQVPEGFYHIDRFNPTSSYYLSLGINYPNQSDKKLSKAGNLGGDIFIHGSCVTIGCLPMTDDKIKEIYLMAIYAKNNGQSKIPVYIFPYRMEDEKHSKMTKEKANEKDLIKFWNNIKKGYDHFQSNKTELKIITDKEGYYTF